MKIHKKDATYVTIIIVSCDKGLTLFFMIH